MSVLRAQNISKYYPGTKALDDVTLAFESGKVHALLGKNGSGKSTLVKIFAGSISATKGELYLDGEKLEFSRPQDARDKGIATIYQEMSLIPHLTVAENIFLGRLPKYANSKVINWKQAFHDAQELLNQMEVDFDAHELVRNLSMWQCQVVEITKAMSCNPKVLMLDEPTSALASSETQRLFSLIKRLRSKDVVILYISHKLHELPSIADTITVLRDGKFIGRSPYAELTHQDIVRMMFGDVVVKTRPRNLLCGQEEVLRVEKLCRRNKFTDVSFSLKKGEILGIAGMLGTGRTELMRSIFGADPYDSGSIFVNGKQVSGRPTPRKMKALGLGLTPEERKAEGVILIHSVRDNLCYAGLPLLTKFHVINRRRRNEFSKKQIENLEISLPHEMVPAGSLSGGNQQKVVIGNWFNTNPAIMMFDEPTRGIDVSAKRQIFQIIWDESRSGVSSIFVSSELEELVEVCHRILIMYMGRIVREVMADDITVEALYTKCMEGK